MKDLRISTVQFENKSGDKEYNLGMIDEFCAKAKAEGSDIISFHECSISFLFLLLKYLSNKNNPNTTFIIMNMFTKVLLKIFP